MNPRETVDEHGTEFLDANLAHELGSRFVGRLRAAGIAEGSRIVFQAHNSAPLIAAVLGCLRGGYVPVMLSDKLTPRERAELTDEAAPALFIDDAILSASMDAAPAPLAEGWHCRPMHFTSGTSGRPKGVWSGWLDTSSSRALLDEEQDVWAFSSSDVHLVVAPLSHSAPLRFPLMTLMGGGAMIVPTAFDPAVVSPLIERGVANTTFMAPAHLQRLLHAAPPAASTMRLVAHAGSACPEHVRTPARALFGDDALREFYGSTEGQFTICTARDFDAHPGTVGRARPGRELRTDPDGRIWCRVPSYARFEYWGDAAKTEEAWDGDWFTVGDLGELNEDGFLFLNGRRSDLIITGGVNVYPAEIERIVLEHPEVTQAVAFGMDDDRWGQRVCLAVVGTASQESIAAHCSELLAPYKRPKDIVVVAELPYTHSGKVDRRGVPEFLGLKV